ncbi:TioE family transcriptional regulator [Solwaraspora sp. WMMA2056]|uniref:TioE family transcriptional regulator n=1 Tax=Solwaraspora sp. WMMA2056 TaxID=3015161 RepID=UPI00338F1C5C
MSDTLSMPGEPSNEGESMRPVDLAREHGLSTQAVRNYEDAGVLPAAARTAAGHRCYTPLHAQSLRAFVALVRGHGHATATAVMRAVNRDAVDEALRIIDDSHCQLGEDRRTVRAVEAALRELTPVAPVPGGTFIGPLAARLGLRPATLRKWEAAGLVRPSRDRRTGYRVYDAHDVRDVLLIHQLRRGGHLLAQVAPLIAQVRDAGGVAPLEATLRGWRDRLSARGRAMLVGAAQLDAYLRERAAAPVSR